MRTDTYELYAILQTFGVIILILLLGLVALSVIMRAIDYSGKRTRMPGLVLQPLRTTVKAVLTLVILTLILGQFGIELMSILTAAIALIAIGFFAVWSLVSHITATILLVVVKPFNLNDTVRFAGEEVKGTVVDVNLFYTSLETETGDRYQVPNNLFFQKTLLRSLAPPGQGVGIEEHLK